MPGGFPTDQSVCNGSSFGVDYTNSRGTAVTASASAGVKGSWTQLTASTSSECALLTVTMTDASDAAGAAAAVDIGVGGSGSEVVVASNLLFSVNFTSHFDGSAATYSLPIGIPAGTRISARAASWGANAVYVSGQIFDGGFDTPVYAGVDGFGFDVAFGSTTFNIDPGSSANTKGAYKELITSTTRDYAGLMIADNSSAALTAAPSGRFSYLTDIAIGGSGSEQIIIPDYASIVYYGFGTDEYIGLPTNSAGFFMTPIPAATRIAARCQSNNNNTQRAISIGLYGLYK